MRHFFPSRYRSHYEIGLLLNRWLPIALNMVCLPVKKKTQKVQYESESSTRLEEIESPRQKNAVQHF